MKGWKHNGPRGPIKIDPETRDIDAGRARHGGQQEAGRQARRKSAGHHPAGEGRVQGAQNRPLRVRLLSGLESDLGINPSASAQRPRTGIFAHRCRVSAGWLVSHVAQHHRQHPVRRPGLGHVPVHHLRRPVGHDGADGLRQSGARRVRHGRRLSGADADASWGVPFLGSLVIAFVVVGAVSVLFERYALSPALRRHRARPGAAHHRPDLHGDRDLHLFLRADPAGDPDSRLSVRRHQSRLPQFPDLPGVPHRRRRRA